MWKIRAGLSNLMKRGVVFFPYIRLYINHLITYTN